MIKISLDINDPEFKMTDSCNGVMCVYTHMNMCICIYKYIYLAIFICGELNLGWVRIFPVEHDREKDRVVEDDCKSMFAMKKKRVKPWWGEKCY